MHPQGIQDAQVEQSVAGGSGGAVHASWSTSGVQEVAIGRLSCNSCHSGAYGGAVALLNPQTEGDQAQQSGLKADISTAWFTGCTSWLGGGAVAALGGSAHSTLSLADCQFRNNSAGNKAPAEQSLWQAGGGALLATGSVVVTMASTQFEQNTAMAGHGGAISISGTGSVFNASGLLFSRNTAAKGHGGAVALGLGKDASLSNITGCVILRIVRPVSPCMAINQNPAPFWRTHVASENERRLLRLVLCMALQE